MSDDRFILYSHERKTQRMGFERRLTIATSKNVMTAVLLSAGPVSSHLTTRNMSSSFKVAVNKARFLSAANQLEAAGFGSLVILDSISHSAHVFVKKTAAEVAAVLQTPEHSGMCSVEEYEQRFNLPTPSYITEKMQDTLVQMGLVPQQYFKEKKVKSSMAGFSELSYPSQIFPDQGFAPQSKFPDMS